MQNLSILIERPGARRAREGAHDALRLTVPGLLGARPLMPVIAAFHERYPAVALELRVSSSAGMRMLPLPRASARRQGLACQVLCASSHYLQKYGMPATVNHLADHACITTGRHSWHVEDASGQLRAIPVGGKLHADCLDFALHCALQGLGIARLPTFLVANELWNGQLVPVLAGHRLPRISLEVTHSACGPVSPAAATLLDMLIEQLVPYSHETCGRDNAA